LLAICRSDGKERRGWIDVNGTKFAITHYRERAVPDLRITSMGVGRQTDNRWTAHFRFREEASEPQRRGRPQLLRLLGFLARAVRSGAWCSASSIPSHGCGEQLGLDPQANRQYARSGCCPITARDPFLARFERCYERHHRTGQALDVGLRTVLLGPRWTRQARS
jgi:hypothetical protein